MAIINTGFKKDPLPPALRDTHSQNHTQEGISQKSRGGDKERRDRALSLRFHTNYSLNYTLAKS